MKNINLNMETIRDDRLLDGQADYVMMNGEKMAWLQVHTIAEAETWLKVNALNVSVSDLKFRRGDIYFKGELVKGASYDADLGCLNFKRCPPRTWRKRNQSIFFCRVKRNIHAMKQIIARSIYIQAHIKAGISV